MSGITRGRLVGQEYRADTLQVRLPRTVMHSRGTFGLARDGRIDASVDVESEDLGEVWPGIPARSRRARTPMSITTGTFQSLDVTGDLTADLACGTFEADSFEATCG